MALLLASAPTSSSSSSSMSIPFTSISVVAAAQLLIYVGAIDVLIVFAVMFMNGSEYYNYFHLWTVGDRVTSLICTIPRVYQRNLTLQPRSSNIIGNYTPVSAPIRWSITVRASSDADGKDLEASNLPKEDQEQAIPVENLPLESKQQMMLKAKLRMKLAKKIRLRRKRLVRKRRLRKKGRWPPSKMKKLKNV